jgi:hypothetical protein
VFNNSSKETSSYRLVYAIWATQERSRCYETVVSVSRNTTTLLWQ